MARESVCQLQSRRAHCGESVAEAFAGSAGPSVLVDRQTAEITEHTNAPETARFEAMRYVSDFADPDGVQDLADCMISGSRRRSTTRTVALDRSLEALPLFRLSDSPDDSPITWTAENGARWRVLPSPGDRSPGTFDQDVYVELMRRYAEAGNPVAGAVSFTLHAFLHSIGRQVDGRTYEQLRTSLVRLHRTVLESTGVYHLADGTKINGQFALLSTVVIERRRAIDRDQLTLFDDTMAAEPGSARVVVASPIRENLITHHVVTLSVARYLALASPVARRLYRLLELARTEGRLAWRVSFEQLREILPLAQRYPSHLQRVLQPAHDLLVEAGILRSATVRQERRRWYVNYVLGSREATRGALGSGPSAAE